MCHSGSFDTLQIFPTGLETQMSRTTLQYGNWFAQQSTIHKTQMAYWSKESICEHHTWRIAQYRTVQQLHPDQHKVKGIKVQDQKMACDTDSTTMSDTDGRYQVQIQVRSHLLTQIQSQFYIAIEIQMYRDKSKSGYKLKSTFKFNFTTRFRNQIKDQGHTQTPSSM